MSTLAVAVRRERGPALFGYARDYQLLFSRLERISDHCLVHQLTALPRGLVMVATPLHRRGVAALLGCCLGELESLDVETRAVSPRALGRLTMYNDNLPFRLGRVPEPTRYRWSTAAVHAGQGAGPIWWSPSSWYTSLGATRAERAGAYGRALSQFRATGPGRRRIPRPQTAAPAPEGTEIGSARLPIRIGIRDTGHGPPKSLTSGRPTL